VGSVGQALPYLTGFAVPDALLARLAADHGYAMAAPGPWDMARPVTCVTDRAHVDSIRKALDDGATIFVELGGRTDLPETAVAVARDRDRLHLSLTTATAFSLDAAALLCDALARLDLVGPVTRPAVELAAHEAVTNAIIHGNLGISQGPSDDSASFDSFYDAVHQRLALGHIAQRRVTVDACWDSQFLTVRVSDEGMGYQPGALAPKSLDAKSGRGLQIIRELADSVTVDQDGRRICLSFRR